jgi:hypothetical protein
MAVLISFIEAVAVHASAATADDVTASDNAADISSSAAQAVGHQSSANAAFDAAAHLSSVGASFETAAHQPSTSATSFESAAQHLSNGSTGFEVVARQLSTSGSPFGDSAHHYHVASGGSAPLDTTSGHVHDAALAPLASSNYSNDGNDSSPALADSDSFWFTADGPVHMRMDADQGLHSATDNFASASDVFADHSAPNDEVTFTSAEPSSFQYSGPSILDTAPGGASFQWADSIGGPTSTLSLANLAVGSSELNEIHQASSTQNIENNVFAIGGGNLKSEAATSAGSAQVLLQAWNGDLGTGYTSAGTASSGSSGSVPGVTSASNGQGLVINVVYDASVANAPPGFTQTIANVVSFYESQFSNPVTITIDVGYGEIDGQSMFPAALGESQAYMTSVSYAQLQSALVANANGIGDTAAAASLAAMSPVDGQYWIPTAEAQSLGIASSGGLDGYAGFTNVPYLDYNVGNDSGTVPVSQYDFFGVVAHEFSEIMGRQMMDGASFAGSPGYTALDLFHYSAPGIPDFSGTTPGYFSPNGGFTNLGSFNTDPYGDFGDWANSVGNNAFLAYTNPGALNPVTASDVTVMNLLGWDSASQPTSGIVTAPPAHGYDSLGAIVSVSATNGVLANVTDSNPNDLLTVSAVNGSAANVGASISGIFGVLTLYANGSYIYFNTNPGGVTDVGGVAEDTFNFTVSNDQGTTANSTLTVLVTAPNETLINGAPNSTIEAGSGPTVLDGGAGDMTAVAGSGHQWLYGGPGDDLFGGRGHDNFMFAPNFGKETIENFHPKHDVISLPSSLFANFAAVEADLQSSGANTVITLDVNDTITLANVSAAHLHAHNFHFII